MRSSLDLAGAWQFRPAPELAAAPAPAAPQREGYEATAIGVPGYWRSFPPDTGGDWGAYDHYGYPEHWQHAAAAWYRRTFDVELGDAAATWRLCFDAVAGRATVWLNGQRLGANVDSFLPFEFDATEVVRAAENELVVLVQPPEQQDGLWLQPCGSWVGWHLRGIWQGVRLERRPPVTIESVFVQPSVRSANLRVAVELSARGEAVVDVQVAIQDEKQTALKMPATETALERNDFVEVLIDAAWARARRWSPDDPYLYTAVVTLLVDGEAVDRVTQRFGFREFWIEGRHFVLNGTRLKLFGDSWHYMGAVQQNPSYARTWFEFARETGVNAIRTHAMPYPPCYFDVADEVGMLIIDESAVYGSAGTLCFGAETFWERSRDHMKRLVRRDRNHPSIIFWSACNETVWRGGEAIFPGLRSLAAAARAEDPTRFVSFDENDCTVGDAAPLHAGHYGTPEHWDHAWNRDRPLVVHEFSTLYHGGPESVCPWGGDAVYADYLARLAAAGVDAADMFMRLRQIGAASLTPWNLNWYCLTPLPEEPVAPVPAAATAGGAPLRRIGSHAVTLNYGFTKAEPAFKPNPAYAPLARCYRRRRVLLARRPAQAFAEASLALEFDVFNDRATPFHARVEVTLELAGARHVLGTRTLTVQPFEVPTERLTVGLPAVIEPEQGTFSVRLLDADSGAECDGEAWRFKVVPRPAATVETRRRVLLVGGDDAPAVAALADARVTLDGIGQHLTTADTTLLLAPPHGDEQLHDWLAKEEVRRWLDGGGRILVLPEGVADDSRSALAPIRRDVRRVFVRDADGPLAGLSEADFADWGDDGVVATQVFERPVTGPALTPLEVGDPAAGLAYTPLVMVPHGAGQVVVTGLALARQHEHVPAARRLLERLLHGALPTAAEGQVALVGAEAFRADPLWSAVGVPATDFDAMAAGGVRIADGQDAAALADPGLQPAALADHFAAGGVLLLDQLSAEQAGAWGERLGVDLAVEAHEAFNVAIPERRPLVAGINNFDLCWVDRDEKQPIVTATVSSSGGESLIETVATRWENYQTAHEQHKVALMMRRLRAFDGPRTALVAISRGDGWILVNQLRLRRAAGIFKPRAQRILSRLLDNCGAGRDPGVGVLKRRPAAAVRSDGYIVQWLALGPFGPAPGHPLDHAFVDEAALEPRENAAAGDKTWQPVSSAFASVDLGTRFDELPPRDRVAYVGAYLYSAMDRSVLLDAPDMLALLLGADGGAKVFLNDAEIGRYDFVRELVPDTDRAENVPLRRGWNKLVIKLHNPSGQWRFTARFVTASGMPVTDLPCQLAPPSD